MLKWIGAVLGVLTLVWIVLQRETIGWSSLMAGIAIASAIYVLLIPQETKPQLQVPSEEKLHWQMKLEEAESKSAQTIDSMSRELQKVQQKAIRAEDRCLSYQNLVEVHQQEIEKLRGDNQNITQELVHKERKLNALHLSKMEPDLFDSPPR